MTARTSLQQRQVEGGRGGGGGWRTWKRRNADNLDKNDVDKRKDPYLHDQAWSSDDGFVVNTGAVFRSKLARTKTE